MLRHVIPLWSAVAGPVFIASILRLRDLPELTLPSAVACSPLGRSVVDARVFVSCVLLLCTLSFLSLVLRFIGPWKPSEMYQEICVAGFRDRHAGWQLDCSIADDSTFLSAH